MPESLLPSVNVTSRDGSGQSQNGNGHLTVIRHYIGFNCCIKDFIVNVPAKSCGPNESLHRNVAFRGEMSFSEHKKLFLTHFNYVDFLPPLTSSRV